MFFGERSEGRSPRSTRWISKGAYELVARALDAGVNFSTRPTPTTLGAATLELSPDELKALDELTESAAPYPHWFDRIVIDAPRPRRPWVVGVRGSIGGGPMLIRAVHRSGSTGSTDGDDDERGRAEGRGLVRFSIPDPGSMDGAGRAIPTDERPRHDRPESPSRHCTDVYGSASRGVSRLCVRPPFPRIHPPDPPRSTHSRSSRKRRARSAGW